MKAPIMPSPQSIKPDEICVEIETVFLECIDQLCNSHDICDGRGGRIEILMQHFESRAHALIDKYTSPDDRDSVQLAYAAGIASAVYGKRSAVADGLRKQLAVVLGKRNIESSQSYKLMRAFIKFGRICGTDILHSTHE
ncbi:hypothetical protein [Burkholderia lata]|uniref:hypothetical protein n=1 Tax=Burkholderia lata (strain ATCC 17760 / DSM 23089 / LMG 22485 / NCIMB 9086 / R18194 / 383) TaxID=482957 RepID=UPI001583BA69|nr:hypothetical protein [Burkholderia lata]